MDEAAPRRRRQWPAVVIIAVVAVGLVVLNLRSRAGGDERSAAPSPAPAATTAKTDELLYVALGDSLARGVQPGDASLERGYPRVLVAALRERVGSGRVAFVEAGCGGATTTSFLEGGKGCAPAAPIPYANRDASTSQYAWARQLLRDRGDRPTLVTLTLGGNDVLSCVNTNEDAMRECFERGTETFNDHLTQIARGLAEVAGARTVLAMGTLYDPVLGYLRFSPKKPPEPVRTFHGYVVEQANPAIQRRFAKAGWAIADLGEALHQDGRVRDANARAVRAVCALTWACDRGDVHLNDEGYRVAADVFGATVESPLRRAYPALAG